jgi:hypothetical protein
MAGTFPPGYFPPDYFGPDYFGGETDPNAMSAALAGTSSVTGTLSNGASANAPTFSPITFSSVTFSTRDQGAISAAINGTSSVTADLTEATVVSFEPLANSGGGKRELWRIYQEILAADLQRKPETKKRKKRKVVEPVLDLPIGGLDGLRAEIATERAAIAALDAQERARAVIRQRREAQERIEWLATQERALEAAIAEVERRRRKRNNETAMLLLAA